jgi:hypothetical protein
MDWLRLPDVLVPAGALALVAGLFLARRPTPRLHGRIDRRG